MFPKEPINWPLKKCQIILWSDKSKIVLSGTCQYVRSLSQTVYKPQYTLQAVKRSGADVNI